MRLLVTGSNGLVGSRLVRLLASRGHEVVALGRGPSRANQPHYRSVDLGDAPAVLAAVRAARPEAIINPAGMTDVDGCEREPDAAYVANVEGVASLCRAAREVGAHVVHVSTDYVFDGEAGPYEVDAVPHPRGTYAITKHLGEQTVKVLAPKDGWTIARTAVVYGWPSTGKNNFGTWLVSTLRDGKPVKLFSDQWVSPTHASSCAEMLAELAERRLGGTWHTCGAETMDRVAFGHALCDRFGFDRALVQPSRMVDVKLPSPRPAKSGLLVGKTTAALTAKPLSLGEALERFHAEYKESLK
ncbi:MAG TPA: SDR family oxidoreductase [Archangium sp.]